MRLQWQMCTTFVNVPYRRMGLSPNMNGEDEMKSSLYPHADSTRHPNVLNPLPILPVAHYPFHQGGRLCRPNPSSLTQSNRSLQAVCPFLLGFTIPTIRFCSSLSTCSYLLCRPRQVDWQQQSKRQEMHTMPK